MSNGQLRMLKIQLKNIAVEKWLKEPMHTETEKISKKIFLKKLIAALVKLNATYDRLKFIYSLIM